MEDRDNREGYRERTLPRIDLVLAEAVREQLDEQRALTRLVSRVEAALAGLMDAARSEPPAGREELLRPIRAEVGEGLRRIERRVDSADGRAAEQFAALSGRLEDLEGALAGLALDGGEERLARLRSDLEARIAAREVSEGHAMGEARRALRDQALQLEGLRGAIAAEAETAAARLSELVDSMVREQRSALAAIRDATVAAEQAAQQARTAVTGTLQAALDELRDTGVAQGLRLREAVTDVQAVAEQAGMRLASELDRAVRGVTAPLDAAVNVLQSTAESARVTAHAELSGLRRALEETMGALDRAVAVAPSVAERAAGEVVAGMQAAVRRTREDLESLSEPLLGAVAEQLAEGREATRAAADRLQALVATATRDLDSFSAGLRAEATSARTSLSSTADATRTALEERIAMLEAVVREQAGTLSGVVEAESHRFGGAARSLESASERFLERTDGFLEAWGPQAMEAALEQVRGALRQDMAAAEEARAALRQDAAAILADLQDRAEVILDRLAAAATGSGGGGSAASPRTSHAPRPEPAPDPGAEQVLPRQCPVCGFVAKTPAGLAAHRRIHA